MKYNVLLMTAVVLEVDDVKNEQEAAHAALLEMAAVGIDARKANWFVRHVTDKAIMLGDPEFSESTAPGGSVDVAPFEAPVPATPEASAEAIGQLRLLD